MALSGEGHNYWLYNLCKFKAWMYQHGVLPRVLCPLLVSEVPMITVEALEKSCTQHLRRWLGLP